MVSHRVEDQTSSEATSVPSWKWKGWAESIHALLEQKTLFAHFTLNCGAQMVPVLKDVYQAESGLMGMASTLRDTIDLLKMGRSLPIAVMPVVAAWTLRR